MSNWAILAVIVVCFTNSITTKAPSEDGTCPPGYHLEDSTHPTVCVPCPTGTFMSKRNPSFSCRDCTFCQRGQKEIRKCTSTKDTLCRCPKGMEWQNVILEEGKCVYIKAPSQDGACPPGYHLEDSTQPTVCVPCPTGTFMSKRNPSFSCRDCTFCQRGQKEIRKCTSTNDTLCRCPKGMEWQNVILEEGKCVYIKSCPAGYFRGRNGSCQQCPEGQFTGEPNNYSQCEDCKHACPQGTEMVSACNSTHDMVCHCPQGSYYHAIPGGTGSCLNCNECGENEEIFRNCTPLEDTRCRNCTLFEDTRCRSKPVTSWEDNGKTTTSNLPTLTNTTIQMNSTFHSDSNTTSSTATPGKDKKYSLLVLIPVLGGIAFIVYKSKRFQSVCVTKCNGTRPRRRQ